ncbi:MAG: hypothetical protein VYE40_17380 [Myxococcota bacterium]|nr:hypothetical protein [Myxococcota bacterium]MEC9442871.1 hypothetical protein [Myxococcota bacterium]
MPSDKPPSHCPECSSSRIVVKRSWPRVFAGVMIVLAMGLIAVPTLGVSLIFMLWGVFLIKERPICQECGWMPTDKRR